MLHWIVSGSTIYGCISRDNNQDTFGRFDISTASVPGVFRSTLKQTAPEDFEVYRDSLAGKTSGGIFVYLSVLAYIIIHKLRDSTSELAVKKREVALLHSIHSNAVQLVR